MNIAQYVKAKSLEEAWELNQKKTAVVFGGGCWLRLSPQRRIQTAIDLSGLGLDTLAETEEAFVLGAMVTLRQIEKRVRPYMPLPKGLLKKRSAIL